MSAEREVIDGSTLSAQVEDPDLRIRDTPVVSRLGIWLVLAIAVAASWTASHLGLICNAFIRPVGLAMTEADPALAE